MISWSVVGSTAPKFKICVNDLFCTVWVAVLKGELP